VAEIEEFDEALFTPMLCELNSFDSVNEFCDSLEEWKCGKPIDRLICNAGVYQPSLETAKWSADGHEQTMQINYLSHFLMISPTSRSWKGSRRASPTRSPCSTATTSSAPRRTRTRSSA